MTTIAYDGKVLAVDSCVTSGNLKFGLTNKLFNGRYNGIKYVAAFAGEAQNGEIFGEWLKDRQRKLEFVKDSEFIGILVDETGKATEYSKSGIAFPACVPWSGGSGEVIAMTVMHLGFGAKKAVSVACELDTHTGLPVISRSI